MKQLIDFLKVGDRVFDVVKGWGTVFEILKDSQKPIGVRFSEGFCSDYHSDGFKYADDINPSLFLQEVKLEQKLPKFSTGETVVIAHNSNYIVAKYLSYDSTVNTHLVQVIWVGGELGEVWSWPDGYVFPFDSKLFE